MSKIYETPNIIRAMALNNYLIYLKYETNEEKIYNMEKLINENKFYNRLKDKTYFKNIQVRGDSIEWKNGEDVAPENLYYNSIDIKDFQGSIETLD